MKRLQWRSDKRYTDGAAVISLNFRQLTALVDLAEDYQGESPRWDLRTISSLIRRGYVLGEEGDAESARLTKLGKLTIPLALEEYFLAPKVHRTRPTSTIQLRRTA